MDCAHWPSCRWCSITWLGGFTGGYVGVDVFLVISGYLITSIIRRDRQAGRFSFVDFWARRARRILPALFVMMAVSLAAGWFLMEPRDYEQLGRAVRYQTMFASNILFWKQDGYFDAASEFKPLLHTWSLSVEEQFYILFPYCWPRSPGACCAGGSPSSSRSWRYRWRPASGR